MEAKPRTPESPLTLVIGHHHRDTANSLSRTFQAAGYTVLAAHNGEQTLRLVRRYEPQLVILDALLNGVDSRLCQTIKDSVAPVFMPVIELAGEQDELNGGPPDGPDAVVRAPVSEEVLLAWTRSLLHTKNQIDRLRHENKALSDASRKLEVLKSEIISAVSHEMSTPLVQVKAAVSLLAEELEKNGSRDQLLMASMAQQALARLEGVVDNIRQLAQAHNVKFSPVSIEDAVDLAARHLERSWASRDAQIRIERDIDPDLPPVLSDKRVLGRLLQLLLDNALKFSPPDSPVTVRAWLGEDNRVWIGVQDVGIGIPPEEHERIFEAFYQVDGSSTRRYGGTGSGLALAVLLANGLNTEIQLDSEPDKGSLFYFDQPVVDLDTFDDF